MARKRTDWMRGVLGSLKYAKMTKIMLILVALK